MTRQAHSAGAPRKFAGARAFPSAGEGAAPARPVGARIEALRTKRNLSREDLARRLGFGDAGAVAAIETGARSVTAGELVLVAQTLGATPEYFTDPFLLAGEGEFSWRHDGASACAIAALQGRAERWVAAYRALTPPPSCPVRSFGKTLGLRGRLDDETVRRAGMRFAGTFALDAAPADRLADVMQREFRILVLAVDGAERVLAGACRLPELDAVLVARRTSAETRGFLLACELFRLLAWEADGPPASRLASVFAEALAASTGARRTRPIGAPGFLAGAGPRDDTETALPAPFSKPFMATIGAAMTEGRLSVRRAARLMETDVDDLAGLFAAHGLECPFDL